MYTSEAPDIRDLSAKTQVGDEGSISFQILASDISEQAPPPTHHLEQAAPGAVILFMRPKMLGKVIDPRCKDGDLHRSRAAVGLMHPGLFDDGFSINRHMQRYLWAWVTH